MAETDAHHCHNEDALQHFHEWRRSPAAQLQGTGGPAFETNLSFIPRSHLETYFEKPRLERLLDAVLGRPSVEANHVRQHYLQTLATLLCIGEERMIEQFQKHKSLRDQMLPHRLQPHDFPFMASYKFEEFKKAQWQFCVSKLEYGMNENFKEDDILPIILKEPLGEGGSANIYKIVVDGYYNSLHPHRPTTMTQPTNTFVLKVYRPEDAEENYNAERNAFMNLKWNGTPTPHIVTHYGGFKHNDSYNNILEYADRKTFEHFMRTTDPPTEFEEHLMFWDRFVDILHGLMNIHGHSGPESSASKMFGLHQDIKPANILVFSGKGPSRFDCHFKIADLGLTHFKPSLSQSNDLLDFDAFGTRAYGIQVFPITWSKMTDWCSGAPETYRFHEDSETAPLQVTAQVDIWSIGCIFSEASVWACHGWKRVAEYRRQRSMEIEDRGGDEGEEIFHFDGKLLDVVTSIHQNVWRSPVSTRINRLILDNLVKDMLQHGRRPDAHYLFDKSKRLITEAEDKFEAKRGGHLNSELPELNPSRHLAERGLLPGEPPSPDDLASIFSPRNSRSLVHRQRHMSASQDHDHHQTSVLDVTQSDLSDPPSVPRPSTLTSLIANGPGNPQHQHTQQPQDGPTRATLSVKQGLEWKKKKKKGEYVILPGGENLTLLNRRDHIFLIDNSFTMRQNRRDVAELVALLAYMLKGSDDDGLDISFTTTSQSVNSKRSSRLSSSIYQQSFTGMSDMRGKLQMILQEHINKFGTLTSPPKRFSLGRQRSPQPQRPLSLYIFTDAKYMPTDVGGFIKDLVKSMKAKDLPKEHVTLSFIRFGNDQASIDKLDELDHGLGLKDINMDIVDHTYWDDDVWKHLLGPLNTWYDDDPP